MINYHVIELDNENRIVFFPKSYKFFIINRDLVDVIETVDRVIKNDEEILLENSNIDVERIVQLLTESVIPDKVSFNGKILSRLVLNISNDCNLRCEYCYASGGNYKSHRGMMDNQTVLKTLDRFYAKFNKIETIQLFGGEPTMNMSAIRLVCEYIKKNGYDTSVGIVTNGTIVSEELIDLISEYSLLVTMSIDIDELHDEMRPFSNGKGSLEVIKNNISMLNRVGQPQQFEVTYTQLHADLGYSIFDVVKQLQEQYDVKEIHLAPVSTELIKYQLSSGESFKQSTEEFLVQPDLGVRPYSMLLTMIKSLKNKSRNNYICFAGFGTISVSCAGDVYPCFIFSDEEDFKYVSVFSSQEEFNNGIKLMQNKYLSFNRYNKKQCENCFAINLCRGCIGDNYFETGDEFQFSDTVCDMTKGMLEGLLINFSKMKS